MELVGQIGKFRTVNDDGAKLEINLDDATQFFRELTVKRGDIVNDRFGVYSFLPVGPSGTAKLLKMDYPKHILQGATNCQTFRPKGGATMSPDTISTMAIEYDGEQCADAFFGDCFERLLKLDNQKFDLEARDSEARAIIDMLVENLYVGLGNSYHDVAHFSRHPLISSANTNGTWNKETNTAKEWTDFVDQMFATDYNDDTVEGLITLIDARKSAGDDHFNVEFAGGNGGADSFDATTGEYTGSDITAEFDKAIRAARPVFKPIVRRRRNNGQVGAVMKVSISVFDAYGKLVSVLLNDKSSQLSGLPAGIYFLNYSIGNQIYNKKIIKQ